jgi:hypothetical protein
MKQILNFILFISIIFSGCAKLNQANNDTLPNWYLNSPSNTPTYIYGTSSGYDIEEAKQNALNNMSSRLIVTVGSSIETKKVSSGDYYSKEIVQNLKVDIEKIRYNNVKIEKNKKVGNDVYVLLKVDRIKLFNERKKEFLSYDNSIDLTSKNIDQKNILEQIVLLNKIEPKIRKNKKRAYIVYAINNSFDYSSYFKKYDDLINNIDLLKSKIVFKVTSNNDLYKNSMINLLNQNNFKVGKNYNITIKLDNNIRKSNYEDWKIIRVATSIKLLANGKNYTEKQIDSIGRSSQNFNEALQKAADNFKDQVGETGLNNLLLK